MMRFGSCLKSITDWQPIALKGQLRWGVQVSVASPRSGKSIYVGVNRGEWGGGLQRVDVQTGVVTNVERRDTKDLRGGPLTSDCDPVPFTQRGEEWDGQRGRLSLWIRDSREEVIRSLQLEIRDRVAAFRSKLPASVDGFAISQESKLPFKAVS